MDLVAHTVRIDHQPGILPCYHARHTDVTGRFVDCDISDPGRPCRAVARELAVNIKRVSEAASADNVAFGLGFFPDRAGSPASAFRNSVDQIDGAWVLQIA